MLIWGLRILRISPVSPNIWTRVIVRKHCAEPLVSNISPTSKGCKPICNVRLQVSYEGSDLQDAMKAACSSEEMREVYVLKMLARMSVHMDIQQTFSATCTSQHRP